MIVSLLTLLTACSNLSSAWHSTKETLGFNEEENKDFSLRRRPVGNPGGGLVIPPDSTTASRNVASGDYTVVAPQIPMNANQGMQGDVSQQGMNPYAAQMMLQQQAIQNPSMNGNAYGGRYPNLSTPTPSFGGTNNPAYNGAENSQANGMTPQNFDPNTNPYASGGINYQNPSLPNAAMMNNLGTQNYGMQNYNGSSGYNNYNLPSTSSFGSMQNNQDSLMRNMNINPSQPGGWNPFTPKYHADEKFTPLSDHFTSNEVVDDEQGSDPAELENDVEAIYQNAPSQKNASDSPPPSSHFNDWFRFPNLGTVPPAPKRPSAKSITNDFRELNAARTAAEHEQARTFEEDAEDASKPSETTTQDADKSPSKNNDEPTRLTEETKSEKTISPEPTLTSHTSIEEKSLPPLPQAPRTLTRQTPAKETPVISADKPITPSPTIPQNAVPSPLSGIKENSSLTTAPSTQPNDEPNYSIPLSPSRYRR